MLKKFDSSNVDEDPGKTDMLSPMLRRVRREERQSACPFSIDSRRAWVQGDVVDNKGWC